MKKHIYTIALSLLTAVTMVGCQEVYSPVDNIPVVETTATEDVRATKATLCGVITKEAWRDFNFSHYEEQAPHYFFLLSQYEDLSDSTRIEAWRDSDTCYAEVSGLTPATIYYYALCVANDYSMVMGEVQSLTTEAKSITQVQSYPVEEYFVNTATLTGFFVAETRCSAAFSLSEYPHFPDTASKVLEANVLKDSCYALVEDLKPATTYYYRLSVSDNYITVTETESWHQFTTYAMPVTVNFVEECTQTSATLTGTFVNDGMDYENLCFMYSTDNEFSEESTKSISPTCQGDVCIAKVEGLQSSTTYYYKLSVILFVNGKECLMESEAYSFTTGEYELTSGQMIDLGLSVNWAAWNVGATSPEEYGGYYAWGETEEKKSYTETSYKYYLADYDRDGESWDDSDEFENIGYNISGTSYDVAHMKWGDGWRMPTPEEIAELINQCTWKEIRYKGTNGWLVIGPNGNNIFLPAAGQYWYGDDISGLGRDFYIWSSVLTLDNIRPYVLASSDDGRDNIVCDFFFYQRYQGLSVRPVTDAKDNNSDVDLDGYPEDENWDARRRR